MYEVREALEIEIPQLTALGKQLHEESAFSHMQYDEVMCGGWARFAMDKPNKIFLKVIIEKAHGKVVGILLAKMDQSYFGKDAIAHDMLLGIDKDHRGRCRDALVWLVNEYQAWAIKQGAKRVFLASYTNVEAERTEKLFEHLGFRKIGTVHEA